ncbi:hypothetical protein evm_007766 [Chilo suppressalis]|nr:hypothetical protein evm_007766 [Chilo suppressalis]
MAQQCYSDLECKIIKAQVERRAKFRKEFLKQRTDPCKHAMESGYVFDEALQRFVSMKGYQLYFFKPCLKTAMTGVLSILPFFAYGYLVWNERSKFLKDCACGKIRYRDRAFKLIG